MMIQVISILLVVTSGILCSGTQQGVSSTQAGQTLQIQPNVRKYNKHTATEKPCTTGSTTTGTRKDKPENYSDAQDYVPVGGAAGPGYPYPYPPYPYQTTAVLVQPAGGSYPYRLQYPYEPLNPAEAPGPYYGPSYNPAAPSPAVPPYGPLPYYPAAYPPPAYPAAYPPSAYPAPYSPAAYPPPAYSPPAYQPPAYPAPQQQLYEQSTVVDAYRSPPYPQPQPAEQSQFFRQPGAASAPYYAPQQPSPHFRAHAYNRPPVAVTPAFLQQRDATATATATPSAEPSQQYEQQSAAGSFDNNQYHY